MAFLSRSPPGSERCYQLKEFFLKKRTTTETLGQSQQRGHAQIRESYSSNPSSSSSSSNNINNNANNTNNERGNEMKMEAIKNDREQQQIDVSRTDAARESDTVNLENALEVMTMKNSYVVSPFRAQTNSTAETIDVLSKRKKLSAENHSSSSSFTTTATTTTSTIATTATSPTKSPSRLSMSRTNEDRNRQQQQQEQKQKQNKIQQQTLNTTTTTNTFVEKSNVTAIVLAGGIGESNPLTRNRAISALNIAGSFRLIDFCINSCLKAELGKVFVLTQYNSRSLNNHVTMTFSKNSTMGKATTEVCVLPMAVTPHRAEWPKGSAAAVRAHIEAESFDVTVERGVSGGNNQDAQKEAYLLCSGEQLHKVDFNEMLKKHNESGAEITMLVKSGRVKCAELEKTDLHTQSNHLKVGLCEVTMKQGNNDSEKDLVKRLHEKPHFSNIFKELVDNDARHSYHVSTGNYIISAQCMKELLVLNPPRERGEYFEFGEHVINTAIERGMKVVAHKYDGFWSPIRSFNEWFQQNLEMARGGPSADMISYGADQQIVSRSRYLPPAKFIGFARVEKSLLLDGCVVRSGEHGSFIESSIIGPTTQIGENVRLKNTIIVGSPEVCAQTFVGNNTELENVCLDSGASVGRDVVIKASSRTDIPEELKDMIEVVDGIVCVLKDVKIPDGSRFF